MRSRIAIIILFIPYCLAAQLTAPGATSSRPTSYPSAPAVKDSIFVYCNESGTQKGTLNATSPRGNAPFNFSWYRWSTTTKSFSISVKTETGVSNSTISSLDEGGYRVIVSGGFDTTMTCWIVFDKAPDVEAKLRNPMKHCNYVALDGTAAATVTSFPYYDPEQATSLVLKMKLPFSGHHSLNHQSLIRGSI